MNARRLPVAVLALALCLTLSPVPVAGAWSWPPEPHDAPAATAVGASAAPTFVQVAGSDRVGTAVEASKLGFPAGAHAVVLCTGWNWPDALGGGALAGAIGGPLLLTRPDVLSSAAAAEIVRLDADRVVVIGSSAAVSTDVATALEGLDVNGHGLVVSRIGGADRFETSAMAASATVEAIKTGGGAYDGTAFFATGYNFPDALAASPVSAKKGWPILLVEPTGLPTATADAVAGLGVRRAVMLGSESAVTTTVAGQLEATLPAPPERLWGEDRYATGVQIARFGVANGLAWNGFAIGTGTNFPDVLAGGVMQMRLGSIVLLTPGTRLAESVRDEIATRKAGITAVRYLGNTRTLSQGVRDAVATALGYPPPKTNGMTFPVAGSCQYSDTWGAPRSGGRTHQGTDIMAAGGTPCVAILSGTVSTKEGGLGGKVTYLDADNGWRFYYAHLSGWIVRSGRVRQGQRIAYVGNTGNAAGGPTHLHLQMWKPNGVIVNPYPYLRQMAR